jgi:hypothetical protein
MGLDVIPPSLIVFFSKTALEFFKFPKVVGLKKSQNSIQVDRMGRLFFFMLQEEKETVGRRWRPSGEKEKAAAQEERGGLRRHEEE